MHFELHRSTDLLESTMAAAVAEAAIPDESNECKDGFFVK